VAETTTENEVIMKQSTLKRLAERLQQPRYTFTPYHHEIYISDPIIHVNGYMFLASQLLDPAIKKFYDQEVKKEQE
jgi:hypothetical protein